jgi:recombination endonuclease VII
MAKTEEQHRDTYLRKSYGIGLADYNGILKLQKGLCGICEEPPKDGAKRFAVDHDHKWKYFKLDTKKEGKIWTSQLAEKQDEFCAQTYRRFIFVAIGQTKSLAIRSMRTELKRLSVRGLLCFKCNTTLRKLYDNAKVATNAGIYLRKHQY